MQGKLCLYWKWYRQVVEYRYTAQSCMILPISVFLLCTVMFVTVAHTTQFTNPGDYYLPVGSGAGHLDHGGSYVSFVDPNTKDITIVLETMVSNTCGWYILLYDLVLFQYHIPGIIGEMKISQNCKTWHTEKFKFGKRLNNECAHIIGGVNTWYG